MNYTELTQCSFLLDEDHFIYDTSEDSETVHLFIKSKPHECSCPTCGTLCRTLTATYQRTLQDTPIHSKQTFLHANLYKYSCSNPDCSRQVFTEALPFARSSQVRTDALNTFILGVAIFLSNECA
ncbi:transposase family protein, partial [Enterococcus avium]